MMQTERAQQGARNIAFIRDVLDQNETQLKWNLINYFKGSPAELVVPILHAQTNC